MKFRNQIRSRKKNWRSRLLAMAASVAILPWSLPKAWATDIPAGQVIEIHVQTYYLGGGKIAALLQSQKSSTGFLIDAPVLALVCKSGLIWSSVDLIFPNEWGNINTVGYEKIRRAAHSIHFISYHLAGTQAVIDNVCNHPHGEYDLRISTVDGQSGVDYIGGKNLDPEVIARPHY